MSRLILILRLPIPCASNQWISTSATVPSGRRTVAKALELSPVAFSVLAIQAIEDADTAAGRDHLDRADLADQLAFGRHRRRLQDRASAAQRLTRLAARPVP
jgi:hypothetical protein